MSHNALMASELGGFQIWEPGNLVPVQVEVVRAPMNIFSYMDHPNDKQNWAAQSLNIADYKKELHGTRPFSLMKLKELVSIVPKF